MKRLSYRLVVAGAVGFLASVGLANACVPITCTETSTCPDPVDQGVGGNEDAHSASDGSVQASDDASDAPRFAGDATDDTLAATDGTFDSSDVSVETGDGTNDSAADRSTPKDTGAEADVGPDARPPCTGTASCAAGQVCCAGGFGRGGGGAATCQAPAATGGCAMGEQVCTPNSSDCTAPATCQAAFGGGGGIMTCQAPGCSAAGGTSPCPSGQVCCTAGGGSACQMGTTCVMGAQVCATTADCPPPLMCLMGGGRGGGGGTCG